MALLGKPAIARRRVRDIEATRAKLGQAHHDVVAGGEFVEQRHDLERAGDALGGDAVRAQARDILAAEQDSSRGSASPGR